MFVFCFFSSRRRHTRYWRDWSSDVCSSDLEQLCRAAGDGPVICLLGAVGPDDVEGLIRGRSGPTVDAAVLADIESWTDARSEERRVGKECRSRWSPYH